MFSRTPGVITSSGYILSTTGPKSRSKLTMATPRIHLPNARRVAASMSGAGVGSSSVARDGRVEESRGRVRERVNGDVRWASDAMDNERRRSGDCKSSPAMPSPSLGGDDERTAGSSSKFSKWSIKGVTNGVVPLDELSIVRESVEVDACMAVVVVVQTSLRHRKGNAECQLTRTFVRIDVHSRKVHWIRRFNVPGMSSKISNMIQDQRQRRERDRDRDEKQKMREFVTRHE